MNSVMRIYILYLFNIHRRRCFLIFLNILLLLSIFIYGCTDTKEEMDVPLPKIVTVKPRVYPTWIKMFYRYDTIKSIYQTSDGGFIAAGNTHFRNDSSPDAWIVKLDAGGNIQWQRVFGDRYRDEFFKVIQTNDGGYLAIGLTTSPNPYETLGFLIKFSSQGDVQWQKTFPHSFFNSVLQASDGNLILTGWSNSFSEYGVISFIIAKLGADGQYKWYKVYGDGNGSFIRQTSDGGYIVLGKIVYTTGEHTRILKIKNTGIIEWQRQYHGILNSIEQVKDGGYLFVGKAGANDKDNLRYNCMLSELRLRLNIQGWLLKLDHKGAEKWQKQYGDVYGFHEDELIDIRRNNEGNLIVLGNTTYTGIGGFEFWIMMIDEKGKIIWQKNYWKKELNFAYDFVPTADHGYVIAAATSLGHGSSARAMIAKVDKYGDIQNCINDFLKISSDHSYVSDIKETPSERPFPTSGQDASLLINESKIPNIDFSALSAINLCPPEPQGASFCPPEPQIMLSSKKIVFGPYFLKSLWSLVVKGGLRVEVKNMGAADLEINEIKTVQRKINMSWWVRTWLSMTNKEILSFQHTCNATIKPGDSCNFTVLFSSPYYVEAEELIAIRSNDPDNPLIYVPVKASVVKGDVNSAAKIIEYNVIKNHH